MGTVHMSVYHASTAESCTLNSQSDGGRGRPGGTASTQAAMRHLHFSAGGLVHLMGEDDGILPLAATGLRGGEGKTNGSMAG